MSNPRASWWIYFLPAPSVAYVLLTWYLHVWGPETPGFFVSPGQGGSIVKLIQPGLAADRAGLKVGDRILRVNDRPASGASYSALAGDRLEMAIERSGRSMTVVVYIGRKNLAYWRDPEGLVQFADVPIAALCLFLACLILYRKPDDSIARLGALVLSLWPVQVMHTIHWAPAGFNLYLAKLPVMIALLPMSAIVASAAFFVPLSLLFFSRFPRGMDFPRWIWVPVFAAAATAAVVAANLLYRRVYSPSGGFPIPAFLGGFLVLSRLAMTAAVPAVLVLSYRGIQGVNERRRGRILLTGLFISFLTYIPDVGFTAVGFKIVPKLVLSYWTSPLLVVGAILSAAGPLALAYAIVKYRLFDVRVIVRLGLQYAAARGLLIALAPFFILLLGIDLYTHADQPLAQILARRGGVYLVLGLISLAAHHWRGKWLAALDRRFFRERYNAQQILQSVLSDVRHSQGVRDIGSRVLTQIESALHPEFAALLSRRPGESEFRVLSSSGDVPRELRIPGESKLVGMIRLLGKPLEVPSTASGWLWQQLPEQESGWLRTTRIEWIYPILVGAGGEELLLSLGRKRSEEPYLPEDRSLIEGVASALAVSAERSSLASPTAAVTVQPASHLPQSLAGRYQLQSPLGTGGMGTVYEATDSELQRLVAVKLIRPELMTSPEAVSRFKLEARAAAGFSHPNVVTIYDFGVGEGQRAYLVMELLSGKTLRGELRAEGKLAPTRAARILHGVCSAVDAAHRRHLLHRDLKPENIFLVASDEGEVPKVLDFGLAKSLDATGDTVTAAFTPAGQLLGTLLYMSPEQLKGEPPAESWDVWALAVVAYEMVTGAHPFSVGASLPAPAAILSGRITSASSWLGNARWDGFFDRALAAEPAQRYPSAKTLFEEFERTLG